MSQDLRALSLVEDPDLVCQVYPSVTPDLGVLSGLCRHQACTCYMQHTCRLTINKIKINKLLRTDLSVWNRVGMSVIVVLFIFTGS